MAESMTNARLAEIDALIAEPNTPPRNHALLHAVPDLVAEIRRRRAENTALAAEVTRLHAEADANERAYAARFARDVAEILAPFRGAPTADELLDAARHDE